MSRVIALLSALVVACVGATLVAAAPTQAAVAQKASLTLTDNLTRVGDDVRATARFSPVRRGRPVYLQQLQGTTWVTIATGAQSSKGGVRFRLPTIAGSRQYRAVTPAQGTLPTRKSATRKLRVKAPGTLRISLGQEDVGIPSQDISADGRYVVYTPVDEGDEELQFAPVIWDRITGVRTTITDRGAQLLGSRQGVIRISADSSTVVSNPEIVPTVWAWDRASGAATRAPGGPGVTQTAPDVSGDGRYVVYTQTLTAGNVATRFSVVRWDRVTGTATEVHGLAPDLSNGNVANPLSARISEDGQWVAVNGVTGPALLWHATDGSTVPVPSGAAYVEDLTADGSILAVGAVPGAATTLVDRATGAVTPVRLSGTYAGWAVRTVSSLTTTGKWLVVTGVRNGRSSVFLVGRASGRTMRASLTWRGAAPNRSADSGVASDDARFVAFASTATDLTAVPEVSTRFASRDVFVRDRG